MTASIRNDAPIADSKMAELSEFTRTMVVSRGHSSQEDVSAFVQVGYSESHILDIILAISGIVALSSIGGAGHLHGLLVTFFESDQLLTLMVDEFFRHYSK